MTQQDLYRLKNYSPRDYLSADEAAELKRLSYMLDQITLPPDADYSDNDRDRLMAMYFEWAYGDVYQDVMQSMAEDARLTRFSRLIEKCEMSQLNLEEKARKLFVKFYKEYPNEVLTTLKESLRAHIRSIYRWIGGCCGYDDDVLRQLDDMNLILECYASPKDGEVYPQSDLEREYARLFTDRELWFNISVSAEHLRAALEAAGPEWERQADAAINEAVADKWSITASLGEELRRQCEEELNAAHELIDIEESPQPRRKTKLPHMPPLTIWTESASQPIRDCVKPGLTRNRLMRGDTVSLRAGRGKRTIVALDHMHPSVAGMGSGWQGSVIRDLDSLGYFDKSVLDVMYSYMFAMDKGGIIIKPYEPESILALDDIWRQLPPNLGSKNTGEDRRDVTEQQLKCLAESLLLLCGMRLRIDCDLYKAKTGKNIPSGTGYAQLLMLDFLTESYTNRNYVVITGTPFPYIYQQAIGQLPAYPVVAIQNPNISLTRNHVALAGLVRERAIISDRMGKPATIDDAEIYEIVDAATAKARSDARKAIVKLLDSYKTIQQGGTGLLRNWIHDKPYPRKDGTYIINPTDKDIEHARRKKLAAVQEAEARKQKRAAKLKSTDAHPDDCRKK